MSSTMPTLALDSQRVEKTCRRVIYHDERYSISVEDVIDQLLESGLAVYASGGAPRDWLLNKEPHDLDLYVDRELDDIHDLLRHAYPGIDPATRRRDGGFLMRWGGQGHQQGRADGKSDVLDICILRSPRDLHENDAWTSIFPARDDVEQNALMSDFSFHSYHYDFRHQCLLDPLGCGAEDLEQRILRLITSAAVLEATCSPTLRILQFLQRGYTADAAALAYLERNADLDVQGMGRRLWNWIPNHLNMGGDEVEIFLRELRTWLRAPASHRLIDQVARDLHPRAQLNPQAPAMRRAVPSMPSSG